MTNDPLNSLIRAATWCVRLIAIAAALVVILLILSFTRLARGADGLERISGPSDWVGWALSDIAQLPEQDRPFVRYLAIPRWGNEKWVPALIS